MSRKPRSVTKPDADDAKPTDGNADSGAGSDGDNVGGGGDSIVIPGTAEAGPEPATVEPTAVRTDSGGDGTPPRRGRGRPRGSGAGSQSARKATTVPINVNGLEKLLVGAHAMLATLTGRMELKLDTEAKEFDGATEAEYLANSIKAVSDHYKVEWFDQKQVDWMNLMQCLAMVYGGRIVAMRMNIKAERAERRGNAGPTPVKTSPPVFQTPQQTVKPNSGAGVVDIPGVQAVEFPEDHPLHPKNVN